MELGLGKESRRVDATVVAYRCRALLWRMCRLISVGTSVWTHDAAERIVCVVIIQNVVLHTPQLTCALRDLLAHHQYRETVRVPRFVQEHCTRSKVSVRLVLCAQVWPNCSCNTRAMGPS